jgi:hypothetical protein
VRPSELREDRRAFQNDRGLQAFGLLENRVHVDQQKGVVKGDLGFKQSCPVRGLARPTRK